MAGFTADLNPKSNAMSLGDMMKMGLYSAETAIANRKAQIAEEQAKETPVIMTFMQNQDKYMTNGRIDLDKASVLPVIAPLTGMDQFQKLVQLHKYRTEADDAEMGLDTKQRGIVASVGETLGYAGVQDPKQYIQAYQGLKQLYPNNMNIAKLADSYSNMIGTMPPGEHVAKAAIKNSVDLLNPVDKSAMMAPKAGTTQVGNALYGTVTQPSILGGQPSVATSPLGGGQGSVTPIGGTTTEAGGKPMPKLIQEDTTMNYAGPANPLNLNKFQEESYAAGKKNIAEVNTTKPVIANAQQAIRKVEDYINSAAGSKLGQMTRQGLKFVFSDAELDMTVKNLATLQARSAAIMGLDKTDSSRDLNSKLSGNVDIAPEALAGVIQQAKAEFKAAELYTQGVNKFVEKRGDVNGYIQEQKFQRKWAEHYDPRIFQVDDIAGSKRPEAEKVKEIGQITGRMTKTEFEKYKEDRQIINRLAKGLYQ
jgi:hypothetical protein